MTFHSIGALLALAIAVSFAPPVPAQQQPAGQVAPQAFNVRDADIRAFIEDVARATGSTFIVDPSVQGTVNFSNDAPMNESERSEEHTSELPSLMRISYAVFCLKKKNTHDRNQHEN